MTVPYSLQSNGYPRTLAEIRLAIEKRIRNTTNRLSTTPSYHRGTPDPSNLPREPLGIWCDWTRIGRDEDETNRATFLKSEWRIHIVCEDEGNDQFGSDSPLAEQVWGDIVKTFTETNTDLGLDGAADIALVPEADHFRGSIAGGNRRIEHIELSLFVRHEMEIVRECPPI